MAIYRRSYGYPATFKNNIRLAVIQPEAIAHAIDSPMIRCGRIRVLPRYTWSLPPPSSPITVPGRFAHRCVFCKSESRFRNYSVVPEPSAYADGVGVFQCARRRTRLPKYRLASPTSCRGPRRLWGPTSPLGGGEAAARVSNVHNFRNYCGALNIHRHDRPLPNSVGG